MDEIMVNKTVRMPRELIEEIERTGRELSEFTRTALQNELAQNDEATREVRRLNRKIDAIDAKSIHGAISDLVVTTQIIFEESKKQEAILKKQNKILKLLLKRSNLAYTFAYQNWLAANDDDEGTEWVNAVEADTEQEIKDLKIEE